MALSISQRIVFTLLLFPFWANGTTLSETELDAQRQIYVRADHALKKRDRTNFEKLKSQIPDYPLYPYLIYDDLKQKIEHSKPEAVTLDTLINFEKQYPDFPFHNTIRNLWLTEMSKTKNWANFVKGYRPTNNESMQCQYHFAKFQTTQDKSHLAKAEPLWLVGYSQDSACDPLFQAWKKNGGITADLINKRIKLALEKKNYTLAKQLSKQLPSKDRQWVEESEKLLQTPSLILNDKYLEKLTLGTKIKTELGTRAIIDLANREPEKAAQWWGANQNDIAFTPTQANQIKREIGISLAKQKSSLAEDWLIDLPKEATNSTSQEWLIRIYVAKQEWPKVIEQLEALPNASKEDAIWKYWLARAKEQLNQKESANEIYQALAKNRNYYGFLASTRLNLPLSMQNEPLKVNAERFSEVYAKPAIKRFEELRKVNKDATARVEWFRAINKMSTEELYAAAKIAHNMGLHDIAIFTIAKTSNKNDVGLRFPRAHEPEIVNNANKYNLDPAWVFGIARQESAFQADAISHADARGLMQLLPSTAKLVAKQYNLPYSSADDLYRPIINIQLGTAFLNTLKKQMYNNVILATAAYNAGPNRIPRWLYDEPMEADRWIENIPYKETREYVKSVITFTSIYRQQLGLPTGFALMLKPIPGKKST